MNKNKNLVAIGFFALSAVFCQINFGSSKMKAEEDPNPAFTCPITNDIFTDPVIAEDRHTCERAAITDWLRKNPITLIR